VFLRILGAVLFIGLCLSMPWRAEAQWSHSPPQWHTLSQGLTFTEVQVFYDQEPVDTLAVVKIDPTLNDFRIFHHKPQNLINWQEEIKAPVVFNASYFSPKSQPMASP
jgi:hypothetical protein